MDVEVNVDGEPLYSTLETTLTFDASTHQLDFTINQPQTDNCNRSDATISDYFNPGRSKEITYSSRYIETKKKGMISQMTLLQSCHESFHLASHARERQQEALKLRSARETSDVVLRNKTVCSQIPLIPGILLARTLLRTWGRQGWRTMACLRDPAKNFVMATMIKFMLMTL
ncbi:1-phosphatidylinositol 4,5-bisphosphate phosphodiesterase eta-1 isoform X2 [Clarias magur]|uniref:1-phosphatidylinositol 4,5-bisphosphate phosphodiesterase eta-1 isoform X2 n=1 Tax=Clarias magur TaxID=1594786 RepID=A0A8J4TX10_CLAMG|nr:1-phosphatidylinositol 4,5-bisphosphate phosphodiesterase eta-1 isoform X2 [Clarias magur]